MNTATEVTVSLYYKPRIQRINLSNGGGGVKYKKAFLSGLQYFVCYGVYVTFLMIRIIRMIRILLSVGHLFCERNELISNPDFFVVVISK